MQLTARNKKIGEVHFFLRRLSLYLCGPLPQLRSKEPVYATENQHHRPGVQR